MGEVMKPRGSVIRLVAEREEDCPEDTGATGPGGTATAATSHSPGCAQGLVGRVSLLAPPCFNTLS